jgi:hypothetical protein
MSFVGQRKSALCQLGFFSMPTHHCENRHARLSFVSVASSVDRTPTARTIAVPGKPPVRQIADLASRGAVFAP